MFEHGFTKIRISQETIVDPCEFPLDASLFLILGQMIFFLFWSFPTSVAMRGRSFLIMYSGIERRSDVYSMTPRFGHNFFQEMPACAIDDAFTPV